MYGLKWSQIVTALRVLLHCRCEIVDQRPYMICIVDLYTSRPRSSSKDRDWRARAVSGL